ncbi:MAG: cyclic pyranopterin monophosphate synthase MoaC [Desulfovibrionaceae bacterium]
MSGRDAPDHLTHLDGQGQARMVDVSGKAPTARTAVARATVLLSAHTLQLLLDDALPKAEALPTARIAGIMAAKKTSELIPLCHPLPISFVDVRFSPQQEPPAIHIEAEARVTARTGVEMEALTAALVAAATIYDMVKAVQKDARITDCRLVYKSGGKSGEYRAE